MRHLLAVFLLWVGVVHAGIDVYTYVPAKAYTYIPLLKIETDRNWQKLSFKRYIPPLIEQESCVTLISKRCFDPYSELNTSRELGVGLGQITKAFRKDGSVRFDALTEIKQRHEQELKEVSWSNVRQRPDLQIRMIVLKLKDNYLSLPNTIDDFNRYIMANSAYNQGSGAIEKDRLKCRLTKGCDPNIWFDNVEKHCTRSKSPIYGKRSACDITREHTRNVFKVRAEKYKQFYE